MLYQCHVGGVAPDEAIATHGALEPAARPATPEGVAFAVRLVTGTVAAEGEIDPVIAACTEHWRPERMAIIDRLILRLTVYQLLHEPDVPPNVAINEAVDLAQRFGGDESWRFVNGVLDAIKRQLLEAAGRREAG